MGGFSEIAAGLRPYPDGPGFKEPTTSRDAAVRISSKAATLRERALEAIWEAGSRGLTADECGAKLGEDWRAIRPRLSELAKAGKIVRTGERRTNDTGLKAAAWTAV